MARAPRSSVPKTSGSGVSRLSYMKGYQMGNRGGGSAGDDDRIATERPRKTHKGKLDAPELKAGTYSGILSVDSLSDIKDYAKAPPATMQKTGRKAKLHYGK